MKILSVLGARPQFIKAAAVSRKLRARCTEILLHTGQHYDYGMSEVFFRELSIPEPEYNLGVGSGTHGAQTGEMLIRIEEVILREKPDMVMVYGDTNSTLAGALSAAKLHVPLAHVEAGLRSYNRIMPEEINRLLTDHCSNLLFCPTPASIENLAKENIQQGVHLTGDVMCDTLLHNTGIAMKSSRILEQLSITSSDYMLATIHRAENTDRREHLTSIMEAFCESKRLIILPLHPRTKKFLGEWGLDDRMSTSSGVRIIEPVGYLDMLMLEKNARAIITDSGGIQKEAYMMGVPCITLREETEWVETVENGGNVLVGPHREKILQALNETGNRGKNLPPVYGDGNAAEKIVEIICSFRHNS